MRDRKEREEGHTGRRVEEKRGSGRGKESFEGGGQFFRWVEKCQTQGDRNPTLGLDNVL